jgi:hypothetical protein
VITTGSKLYFGYFFGALVSAFVYGYTTGGNHVGPLTVGYKGGVGEHVGYAALLTAAVLCLGYGLLLSAFRDADARAAAQLLGTDQVPSSRPLGASYWPVIGAFGAGAMLIGLVLSPAVFIAGVVLVVVVAIEWAMQAWADRATGDPEVNAQLRDRIMNPIEVPVLAAIAILLVPLTISRVFLTVTEFSAIWVAAGVATVVFAAAVFFAFRPRLSKNTVAALVLLGGAALIAAGIISAAVGERHFEKHQGGEHALGIESTSRAGS